jgi:hypothetical protein
MAESAKVLSVQALRDFRVALVNFVEEARNALSGVDMELRRMREWLERDQLSYWQAQVKRRHEAMMMARTELHRRQIAQQGSDAISDTEQREALREAQRRLRAAEEKVETVKRLIPVFHHVLSEYRSHSTPLADHLAGGVERSLGSLEKMVQSLEAYLALQAPSAPAAEAEPAESGAAPMTSAARPEGPGNRADADEPPAAPPSPTPADAATPQQEPSP